MKQVRTSLRFTIPFGAALLASTALIMPTHAGGSGEINVFHVTNSGSAGNADAGDGTYSPVSGSSSFYSGPGGDGTITQYQNDSDPSTTMNIIDYNDGGFDITVWEHTDDSNNNGNGDGSKDDGSCDDCDNNPPPDPNAAAPAAEVPDPAADKPVAGGAPESNNPNPDDDSGRSDKPDVPGAIRSGQISIVNVKVSPASSPVMQWVGAGGFGFDPHGNPGDYGTDTGPSAAPNRDDPGLTAEQLASLYQLENAAERTQVLMGTSMGSGDEGGSESARTLNTRGSGKGNTSGNGNNSDDGRSDPNHGKNKTLGATDSLGARPDLVNPPHSKTGSSKTGKTGTSSVMQPGLLDRGSAFGGNGPAAAGSSVGSGHSGSTGLSGGR